MGFEPTLTPVNSRSLLPLSYPASIGPAAARGALTTRVAAGPPTTYCARGGGEAPRARHHPVVRELRDVPTPSRRRSQMQSVARPGFEPGLHRFRAGRPAVGPSGDSHAPPGVHSPRARRVKRWVDPKGLEPSHGRVRAAASAARGSGSERLVASSPEAPRLSCLNVQLLRLFHSFVYFHSQHLSCLKMHPSRRPTTRWPRALPARPSPAPWRRLPAGPSVPLRARSPSRSIAPRGSHGPQMREGRCSTSGGGATAFFDRGPVRLSSPHGPAPPFHRGFVPAMRS